MDEEEISRRISKIERRLEKLEGLALNKKLNINLNKHNEIFSIEDNKLTILKTIGENTEEKTQNVALLTLLEYKTKLNINNVLSSEIKRNVALNKIPIENFATFIKKLIPQLIRRSGKPKSNKLKYRLTPYGEAKAKELIKKY